MPSCSVLERNPRVVAILKNTGWIYKCPLVVRVWKENGLRPFHSSSATHDSRLPRLSKTFFTTLLKFSNHPLKLRTHQ